MKYFCITFVLTVFLVSCSIPDSAQTAHRFVVLNDKGSGLALRSLYKDAVISRLNTDDAIKLLADFPVMLNKYVVSLRGINIENVITMQLLYDAGNYRVQIVPFIHDGRKFLLMNLLGGNDVGDDWRTNYVFVNDGGVEFCVCLIDQAAEKVIWVRCNGEG